MEDELGVHAACELRTGDEHLSVTVFSHSLHCFELMYFEADRFDPSPPDIIASPVLYRSAGGGGMVARLHPFCPNLGVGDFGIQLDHVVPHKNQLLSSGEVNPHLVPLYQTDFSGFCKREPDESRQGVSWRVVQFGK